MLFFCRRHFYGQDHQNWFGMDENVGPVAASIKKERENPLVHDSAVQYRVIVRTSEVSLLLII